MGCREEWHDGSIKEEAVLASWRVEETGSWEESWAETSQPGSSTGTPPVRAWVWLVCVARLTDSEAERHCTMNTTRGVGWVYKEQAWWGLWQVITCMSRRPGFPAVICLQRRRPASSPWVGKIPWRRKWQPTPVLLPGESQGQRSLLGFSPWGCKESDTT